MGLLLYLGPGSRVLEDVWKMKFFHFTAFSFCLMSAETGDFRCAVALFLTRFTNS